MPWGFSREGIYGQVGSDPLMFAEFVDLRSMAVPIIIIGALLVIPLLYSTVTQIRSSTAERDIMNDGC